MTIEQGLRKGTFLLSFLLSVGLQAQDLSIQIGHALPKLGKSAVVWADFNNDGIQEVALSGVAEDNQKVAAVYAKTADGTYLNTSAGLTPVSDGALAVGDVNRDGLTDILLCGIDGSSRRITRLYLNLGNGNFMASPAEFKGMAQGKVALADIDNDGRLDVLLNGIDSEMKTAFYAYLQQADGSFAPTTEPEIPGISQGDWVLADFNQDGYPDILQSGLNQENYRRTQLFLNSKNKRFEQVVVDLPALANSMMAIHDLNKDGYPDLFLAGKTLSGKDTAALYHNTQLNNFRFLQKLNPVSSGAAAFADINYDGFPDLVYAGYSDGTYRGYYYTYAGPGSYTLSQNLAGIINGDLGLNDFNNDGKSDIFMSGYSLPGSVAYLYRNTNSDLQQLPAIPTGLKAESRGDSVALYWDGVARSGHSYDLYIGTAPAKADMLAPLADLGSGWRKVSRAGTQKAPFALVKDLPEGVYYWGVQAVDAALQGSPFSTEGQFSICHTPDLGPDRIICYGEKLVLQQGKGAEEVSWYSKQRGWLANTFTYEQTITENDTLIVAVKKPYTCTVYDTLLVQVRRQPPTFLEATYEICLNETIELTAGAEGDVVNWYNDNRDPIVSASRTFSQRINQPTTLNVEIIEPAGCKNWQEVVVEPLALPDFSLGHDQAVCVGSELRFAVEGFPQLRWYTASGSLAGTEGSVLSYTALKTDTLWAEVYNAAGCVQYDTVIVQVNALPEAKGGEDKIFCLGASVQLGGSYENMDGLQFHWEPAAFVDQPDILNPLVTVRQTAAFYLTVTDANGCVNRDTVMVYQDAESLIAPGDDRYICLGESTLLGGEPTAKGSIFEYSYQWSPAESLDDPASPNPLASPQETTTYRLITSTGSCVVDTSYVTVEVKALPVVSISEDVTVGFGETTPLQASGGVGYYWYPQTGLDNYNISNPIAAPAKTTEYHVVVTDEWGCQQEASLMVYVKNDLFVPNLFTPNQDGNNDTFRLYGNGVQEVVFSIYNRYGKLVFTTSDLEIAMSQGWDGTVEGARQESGIYTWSLKGRFFDGKPLQYKGNQSGTFKLIR